EETGLYYNWWRWYKSETGRYIEVDKYRETNLFKKKRILSNSQDKENNLYLYSLNNTLFYSDYYGLDCLKTSECIRCLRLFGGPDVQNALDKLTGWGCDELGIGCPDGPGTCCGYADVGSGFIYITNISSPICSKYCFVVLHEIAHSVLGASGDEEANYWADRNLPSCCK
ncbi:MAG: hypothetical protein N2169_07940, partial [bacterium]|nr:hypothetical protein [bacterium]